MKRVVLNLIIVCIVLLSSLFMNINIVEARSGCCSHHHDVAGCSGGYNICNDGAVSSCTCGSVNDGLSFKTTTSTNRSYGGYYNGSNTNDKISSSSEIDLSWILYLGIGLLLFVGVISNNKDEKAKTEAERRKNNPTEEEYEQDYQDFVEQQDLFLNRYKNKDNARLIDVEYYNKKIKVLCWINANITSYKKYGQTYYETLSRELVINNVGKNKDSFEIYRTGLLYNNRFETKKIYICDSSENIRTYFKLRSNVIKTRNIKNSKVIITKPTGIKIELVMSDSSNNKLHVLLIDLFDLKKLSEICGTLEVYEV